ncbi:MAG TPA: polyprenyl synthetase family protein [Acidimicrobiales bacterium]|jgi:geranylgeranyl diphosphate synthase type II|nr:polyprenyl synthetase family protein [Acidimicrobiales bacterium]
MTATDLAEVEATLARYGELTRGAMQEFLADEDEAPYLTELLADYPGRGGKALRPALVLATCQAYGGSLREAMGPAVAIEMLHNAFLIHDDIEDQSHRRRGRPTLHRLHGVPLALNTGDALAMLSLQPLRDDGILGSRIQQAVLEEYLSMAHRTIAGQAKELGWRRDNVVDLGPNDYLELIGAKTCWYTTIYPLRVGALIGSRGSADLEELTRFGFYLGAAFQIRDDLLNLLGTEEEYGKELFDDVWEGKRTLMLIHVLAAAAPPDRRWLEGYLAKPAGERTPAEIERVVDLMAEHGSVGFAIDYGHGIADAAHVALDRALAGVPPSHHVDFIAGLVPYMLERTR